MTRPSGQTGQRQQPGQAGQAGQAGQPPRIPPNRGILLALTLASLSALLSACAELDPYALSRPSGSDGGGHSSGPQPGSQPGSRSGSPATPRAPLPSGSEPGRTTAGGTWDLPASVRPPATATERLRTQAIGDITYECRRHLTEPTRFVWSFVVPAATLFDANQRPVGRYYAGPTWEGHDKSKVTGRQVGSSPGSSGDLPLQLIKADVSTGNGIMKGVSYIQRLNTRGGLPSGPCDATLAGKRQQVGFQADYVFY